ncbi:MAG: hypothetical protein JNN09_05900 [Alphaproteobacteria bacterium]|nr:hypothetical protein [Alphaproteobacteria bacterium]
MVRFLYGATLFFLLFSANAHAESHTYAPENCDFTITFPEKPYVEKKCSGEKDCAEVVTFTKVLDIGSSVNFRVTCISLAEKELAKYTPEVMKTTLGEMLKQTNLEAYNIDAEEKDGYKRAGSVSLGKRNDQDILHTGQLWVGKKSLFTMEGEMLGASSDKLNQLFADILKTVQVKSGGAVKKESKDSKTSPKEPAPAAAQP